MSIHQDTRRSVTPTSALAVFESEVTYQEQSTIDTCAIQLPSLSIKSPDDITRQLSSTGSNSVPEKTTMPSRSTGPKSSRQKPAKSSMDKSDDWSNVTEPDERRRIQNRIAQRKFREKAREKRAAMERNAQNEQNAECSYRIPHSDDITASEELSGLPWGGLSFQFMVAKGHERASQENSRRASHQSYEYTYPEPHYGGYGQFAGLDSYDNSSGTGTEEPCTAYDGSPFSYTDFEMGGSGSNAA